MIQLIFHTWHWYKQHVHGSYSLFRHSLHTQQTTAQMQSKFRSVQRTKQEEEDQSEEIGEKETTEEEEEEETIQGKGEKIAFLSI